MAVHQIKLHNMDVDEEGKRLINIRQSAFHCTLCPFQVGPDFVLLNSAAYMLVYIFTALFAKRPAFHCTLCPFQVGFELLYICTALQVISLYSMLPSRLT